MNNLGVALAPAGRRHGLRVWLTVALSAMPVVLMHASARAALGNGDRVLTLQERFDAQEKIERVYYSHMIGAHKPFQEEVTPDLIEKKVRTYQQESVALERFWHTPVTREALRAELARISNGTQFPDRLRQIYASLGDDPVVILECFVRPILVHRLSRNFFYGDHAIHEESWETTRRLQEAITQGKSPEPGSGARHRVIEYVAAERGVKHDDFETDLKPSRSRPIRVKVGSAELKNLQTRAGLGGLNHVTIKDNRESLAVTRALHSDQNHLVVEAYEVPKMTWEAWWNGAQDQLETEPRSLTYSPDETAEVGRLLAALPTPASLEGTRSQECSLSGCMPADSWDNGILDSPNVGRTRHTAVWTGTEMLIWGGVDVAGLITVGQRYNPLTDTWAAMSTIGAPEPRVNHVAVWTGSEMIVWGGLALNTGGRYSPANDTWLPTSTVNAPPGSSEATGVWTSSRLVVWGGRVNTTPVNTGGRYDPSNDSWLTTTTAGAPTARFGHSAVWTGSRMIIWGGGSTNTGARYDPAMDTWAATSTVGAPAGRKNHAAVWTGSSMIIWAGLTAVDQTNTGGKYDPVSNTWTATSLVNVPEARATTTAVWTGTVMLVWGGSGAIGPYGLYTGGRYNPNTNSWSATSLRDVPAPRYSHSAIWAENLMVIWGGTEDLNEGVHLTGGRYDPSTDSWTAVGSPSGRGGHTAVWTGTQMIIWGGGSYLVLGSGGRYDPMVDSWFEMSKFNAPEPRALHSAIWTGDDMVVWGGAGDVAALSSGAKYDPVSNLWTPTSDVGAPTPRYWHTAIWTGTHMVVWGGHTGAVVSDGARYDPALDSWQPVTTVNAPGPRERHQAVWTGSEMIVWGGGDGAKTLSTGGRYRPATDTWESITLDNAPSPRVDHSMVWTGQSVIVWGGGDGSTVLNTGGQYDPAVDRWIPTSLNGAPFPRSQHLGLWTGEVMLVWGGTVDNTGGRYDPLLDRWTSTTQVGAPPALAVGCLAGVWTGSSMLIWGAEIDGYFRPMGGRYMPGIDTSLDSDGDGVSVCRGDCDDGDDQAWSTPGEVANLVFAPDGVTMTWAPPWPMGGTTVTYDLLRSDVPGDFAGPAACIETDDGLDTLAIDVTVPSPGSAYVYLVRAENACLQGQGVLGRNSSGVSTVGRDCP